jgi:hypothetical protein
VAEAVKGLGHIEDVEGLVVDAICDEDDGSNRGMVASGIEQESMTAAMLNRSGASIVSSNLAAESSKVGADDRALRSYPPEQGSSQICGERNVQLVSAYHDMMTGNLDEALSRIRSM